ncbi:MAG: hypothetical protein IKN54_07475 [Lachnospiraceae bacterium]|nr:hypothetical protein [Lachnospiraceae bacterium]
MKKLLKLLAIGLFTVGVFTTFTGCLQLISSLLGNVSNNKYYEKEKEQTYTVKDTGTVYFVKYNTSDDIAVKGAYTGYITGTKSRNEETDETEEIDKSEESIISSFSKAPDGLYNDNELINQMNAKFASFMNKPSSERSAYVPAKPVVNNSYTRLGDTRSFYLLKYTYNSSGVVIKQETVRKQGKCVKVSTHCNVWFVDQTSLVDENDLDFDSLAKKFDSIYEMQTKVFGENTYTTSSDGFIPSSDKIQIVICDCMGDAKKEQSSGTFGYQAFADLLTNEYIEYLQTLKDGDNWKGVYSNEDQIIYIDSLFYSYKGKKTAGNPNGYYNAQDTIFSTIPHEFNHLLNNIQKYIKNDTDEMATWYTEMLSLITEDLFMDSLGINESESARGRLPYFDNYYNYGFTTWLQGNDVFISYANAFAYGAFLCRNYGGEKLIKEIATNDAVNEASITKALAACGYKETFEDTVKDFANVIINTSYSGKTLNKSGSTTTGGLSLSAIDLNIDLKDSTGKVVKSYSPKIYAKDDMPNLYPTGFSVHKVGTNLKSFTYFKAIKDGKNCIESDVIIYK